MRTTNTLRPCNILMPLFFLLASGIVYASPESDRLFQKAEKNFFNGNFPLAETQFRRVISADPGNPRAHAYLGDIYLKRMKLEEARQHYKKSIDLSPDNADNYFRLGQVSYYQRKGTEAVDFFRKAVTLNPQLRYAHYHIGLSYLMLLRDKNNTIQSWETYLRIAPEDPQYDRIRRVIALLKDPSFTLPPADSDVSLEDYFRMGSDRDYAGNREVYRYRDGRDVPPGNDTRRESEPIKRKARDEQAGHEEIKTKKKVEDLYSDDDL